MPNDEPKQGAEITLFRKKRQPLSQEERLQRLRAKARRTGNSPLRPIESAFLAEMLMNGGNASAAARKLGLDPSAGARWKHKPAIRAALEHMQQQHGALMQDWAQLAVRAQATLVDLLDSDDDRVRLSAAQYVTDRGLGKVAAKVEATVTHQAALSEIEMQAALSLVAGANMSLAEASAYVRAHPDEVAAWVAQQSAHSGRAVTAGKTGEVEQGEVSDADENVEDAVLVSADEE